MKMHLLLLFCLCLYQTRDANATPTLNLPNGFQIKTSALPNWVSNPIHQWLQQSPSDIDIQIAKRNRYYTGIKSIRNALKYANRGAYLATWVHFICTNDLESLTSRFLVSKLSMIPIVQLAYLIDPDLEDLLAKSLERLLRRVSKHTRPTIVRFLLWYFSPYQVPNQLPSKPLTSTTTAKTPSTFWYGQSSLY